MTNINFCEGNMDIKNISLDSKENLRIINFLKDSNNGDFDYIVQDFFQNKLLESKINKISIFSNNHENLKNKRILEIYKINILRKIITIQKNFKNYNKTRKNLKVKSQKPMNFYDHGEYFDSNINFESKNYLNKYKYIFNLLFEFFLFI